MDQPIEKTELSYPDSNRIGKFNINFEQQRNGAERPMLQALFGLCIVLEVENHESGRGKTYYAASELFQPQTATGKLKAEMMPTTPSGCHCSIIR